MLTVRVAAALARTLPRRAGFVSIFKLFLFGFFVDFSLKNPDFIQIKRHGAAVLCNAYVYAPEDTGPFTEVS